ncbi:MAG: hypothetical protein JSV23_00185 [Promethearchaeota archaeon]|nr:MAG: hypothetical protein JSV23_00185 [Candidatus Lokiarchaeota archaeon]
MPIRIRWLSREYFGIGLLILGICGIFQLFFIFIGQYFLAMGSYIIVVLIPIVIWIALFFATIIIFESYAQVERREKLRSQFRKSTVKSSKLKKFLNFPITKPLLIVFILFNIFFFSSFFICALFLNNSLAFLIAENASAVFCLLMANLIERNYGRVKRY